VSDALIRRLTGALGPTSVLVGEEAVEKSQSSWSRMGKPLAVVRPSSVEEVQSIVRLCGETSTPICPWGGKTGLVHGGQAAENAIALTLERMHAIEEVDVVVGTLSAQAGCILQVAGDAAEAQDMIFPLDLGARGSATLGGAIATNAGGNRVIRYGMTRDMVLGLEVVLADGGVLSSMNHLIKNNAGYDLKQMFIGAEGTLGAVTRAVVRLRAKPRSQDTAFVACSDFAQLPKMLRHMERGLGGTLSAFEVMWASYMAIVTSAPATHRNPLSQIPPYTVLIEAQGADQESDSARFEQVLMDAAEQGMFEDAVIAKSQSERNAMWELRDDVGQTSRNWPIFTYDVSLRIGDMESYVAEVRAALEQGWGDRATLTLFGHLGDGNLHLIVGVGSRTPETKKAVNDIIYGGVRSRGGFVSAEHGIGLEKRDYLPFSRSPEEIEMMRRVKRMLDPQNLFNPGKLLV
jgi:FAD/FMN-containing dehydrogenase